MKKDKELLFDDNETAESLHRMCVKILGERTAEEIEADFEKTFGKEKDIA